jgi:hypothetical protein
MVTMMSAAITSAASPWRERRARIRGRRSYGNRGRARDAAIRSYEAGAHGRSCEARRAVSHVRITSRRQPIPYISCGVMPRGRTGRSWASARRAWPSAAWPACSSRSKRCSRKWGRDPPRSCGSSSPHATAPRSIPSSTVDSRPRSGRALLVLQRMLREHGSIEAFFAAGDDPRRATSAPLSTRSPRARSRRTCAAPTARRGPARAGVAYFFPRPSAGSACKRLNLFLRWMVRSDAIDMGVWRRCRRRGWSCRSIRMSCGWGAACDSRPT